MNVINKIRYSIVSGYMRKKIPGLCKTDRQKAVKYVFWCAFMRFPNLEQPKDINEKLNYLKLHDYYNNEVITRCVDKLLVKDYLKEKGYGSITAKLYGEYNNAEEIRWDDLPDSFVLKCNHGCGYNIMVEDKNSADKKKITEQLNKWLSDDSVMPFAEFQYEFVNKKIFAEELLGHRIKTYKFYCFNGEPRVLYVSQDDEYGNKDMYLDYYDLEWNHLDIKLNGHLWNPEPLDIPEKYEEMISLSRELAKDFPFVRVDLYEADGNIKFSEFTFLPTGGYMNLEPADKLRLWGDWLKLD